MRQLPDDDDWPINRRQAIAAHLRAVRLRQNLTQDDVWQAARLDRRTIQHVEAGQEIMVSTLLRIAYVLEVPLAELDE